MNGTKLYNREILPTIEAELESPYAVFILGSRRVGKTTLLKLLQNRLRESGVPPGNILYFDLENPIFRQDFEEPHYDLVGQALLSQAENSDQRVFVFLDEVQYLKEPSGLIKYLVDHYPRLKFILSGSSSLRIKTIFRDSMVGRKRVFRLYPLTFAEFLRFKEKGHVLSAHLPVDILSDNIETVLSQVQLLPSQRTILLEEIFDFLTYGGYPEPTLLAEEKKRQEALFEFYSAYVQKDIGHLFAIDQIDKFNKLIRLYAAQIGNLVNFTEVANTLGISRKTVEKYSFLQQSTFVVEFIAPHYSNVRKELTKMPKVYLEDVGVRNAILNAFHRNEYKVNPGNLAENYVLNQLQKRYSDADIHFWRTKSRQEVDFVLSTGTGLVPVEVKFTDMQRPIFPGGLKAFITTYSPGTAFVITRDFLHHQTFRETRVYWLPIYFL